MKTHTILLGACLVLANSASAASIAVNLTFDDSAGGSYPAGVTAAHLDLASGDSAGVVAQTNWNNLGVTVTTGPHTITDAGNDSGVATTLDATFTINSSAPWAGPTPPMIIDITSPTADEKLFNHGVFMSTGVGTGLETTVSVSQVPYAQYDIYLYVGRPDGRLNGRNWQFELNGTTSAFVGEIDDHSFSGGSYVEGSGASFAGATDGNYVKFSGVTGSSFSIRSAASTGRETLAGMQIVQVPEPSGTLALVGLGALAFMRRRRG